MTGRRQFLSGLGAAALLSGCGQTAGEAPAQAAAPSAVPAPDAPLVLVSFSILEDLVRQVAGPLVRVRALVGANEDSHHFDPAPSDLAGIGEIALAVRLGLGFDSWLDRALEAAGFMGPVLTPSDGLPVLLERGGRTDPHVWQSHRNAGHLARSLASGLTQALSPALSTGSASQMQARAAALSDRLQAGKAAAQAALAEIAPERRLAIVPHRSFDYLGAELDVRLISLASLTPGSQPSARQIGRLIEAAKASGAGAVFTENIADGRLIEQVASLAGLPVGGQLISDALTGPEGVAPGLEQLLAHNAATLARALGAASGG